MGSGFSEFCDYTSDLTINNHASWPYLNPYLDPTDNFSIDDLCMDLGRSSNAAITPSNIPDPVYRDLPSLSVGLDDEALEFPSTTVSSDGLLDVRSMSLASGQSQGTGSSSPSDDGNSMDPVLKYIKQMLMEENMEEKTWAFEDQIALQNAEKSLYDVLGKQYPNTSDQAPELDIGNLIESPSSNSSGSSIISSSNPCDHGQSHYIQPKNPARNFQSNPDSNVLTNPASTVIGYGDGSVEALNDILIRNMFTDSESILQIKKGLEEARKFLPSGTQLIINSGVKSSAPEEKGQTLEAGADDEKVSTELFVSRSRRLKNHERDDSPSEEERANKQTALSPEESMQLSEMFDRVLLSICHEDASIQTTPIRDLQPHGKKRGSRGRGKKQGSKNTVDLRTLLILCAQAVSANDVRTANELLKQIRENSSPSGDATQRLAHYFANGLEARFVSSDDRTRDCYTNLIVKRTSAADILKAYDVNMSTSPLKKFPIFFADYTILELSEQASVIHIIDFGIAFGFQWPILIKKLSERPGGAPKLRITGIELPQPGFRPEERIEETGNLLEKYCKRFGVPFEYNGIASQNWEYLKIEDLKIHENEFIAVNCLIRFNNLLDETFDEDNSPRDAVLNLIRSIKPDVFVHAIANGSYNAPFFVTRFREALFHLSAAYDVIDATISGESDERLITERDFHGREIMNVIACEGPERIERPETYKQWQVRHIRAGFRSLPLDQKFLKLLREKMKEWYHKDFVLDEDNDWMLLGWRGRILYATACWVPA